MGRNILVLFTLFVFCTCAHSQEWIQVKNSKILYSPKSVKYAPVLQRAKVLTKTVYGAGVTFENGQVASYSLDYREYDRPNKRYRILKTGIYNEAGNIITSNAKPDYWQDIVAKSGIEELGNIVFTRNNSVRTPKEGSAQSPNSSKWGNWKAIKPASGESL